MKKPLLPIRDLFLAPPIAFLISVLAEKIGYFQRQWHLALGIIVVSVVLFAGIGIAIRGQRSAALNAYSVSAGIAALLFALKWWNRLQIGPQS